MAHEVTLITGDGTGPELVEAMALVLEAAGSEVQLIPCEAGLEWWQQHGGPSFIPESGSTPRFSAICSSLA